MFLLSTLPLQFSGLAIAVVAVTNGRGDGISLMMTSAASLSEIALSVGFSDQAHLCRLFRRAFGQSPASWRRDRVNIGQDNPARTRISNERSN
jgi:AraC-like DNA-binding protein